MRLAWHSAHASGHDWKVLFGAGDGGEAQFEAFEVFSGADRWLTIFLNAAQ